MSTNPVSRAKSTEATGPARCRPGVSVVIPAYKAEATIRRAVDSVLAQEGVETRVIVVIDGLIDGTKQALEGYDPERVSVIVNPQNLGAQVSRNKGLAAAENEYVMFLDCDDFIEGPLLKGLVDKSVEDRADIAFGPMRLLKLSYGRDVGTIFLTFDSADDLFRTWVRGRTVNPCSVIWRTDFLRRIGGWDERLKRFQPLELVARAALLGARFTSSPQGCGVYVIHPSTDRITRRPENLASNVEVGEALLAIDSSSVSERAKREALAIYFYRAGLQLQAFGWTDLARQALDRARELGLQRGLRFQLHRLVARAIGLPFKLGIFRMDQSAFIVWAAIWLAHVNLNRASLDGRMRFA